MSSRAKTWQLFYHNLPNNQEVNQKMVQIMGFNRFQLSSDDWISNLKNNHGLALLLVNGFHDLILLHNVSFLQENIFCAESKLLGLLGGTSRAEVYRIDPISASLDLEFQSPVWRDLKNVASADLVNNLQVPDQNPSVFRGKVSLIVPPLVKDAILELGSLVPSVLIPMLSTKFQEFDRTSNSVKACTSLRPVLEYLWAAHQKRIPPTTMAVDSSSDGKDWSARLHYACIDSTPQQNVLLPPPFLPPPPVPNPVRASSPIESIAGDIRVIRDATERQLLREIQNEETKRENSNGWEKLPDVVQDMILKISATSDDTLPLGPHESYLKLLKQPKALGVAMVLNIELSIRGCQVEVPTNMANAIKSGNFRANSLQVAHPFSIFNVPYMDAASMTSYNKTELDLLQSEGEGIPKDIVKKLAENKFRYPDNSHHLRHQLNNWYGVLQVCFGEHSLVAKEIKSWIIHLDKYELYYDACFKTDIDFGARVLGLIDLTFFQLCDSCLRAKTIEEVDYSQISLASKRFDILQNCFQANKPVYLTSVTKKPRDVDEDDLDELIRKRIKLNDSKGKDKVKEKDKEKDKYAYRDLGNIVKNMNSNQDWILTGPQYKAAFTKEVISTTPAFNESGLTTCNKWHARGFCYEKCDRRLSHKRFESAPHKSAYDKWVRDVKAKCP
jgi:hypothetical protein